MHKTIPPDTQNQSSADLLDDIDRKILNRIQSRFPIEKRPYRTIAEELELEETLVIERLQRLKAIGIIRRIGGNLSPDKLGFVSTLCAAEVPPEKMALFTETVNRYPGVTHNYQRDNQLNVWFTFIAPSMDIIEANLNQIIAETGIKRILNLPATHLFKIKAEFDV